MVFSFLVLVWLLLMPFVVCSLRKPTKYYQDLSLGTYDDNGNIMQAQYSQSLIDKSPPLISFIHHPSKLYIIMACNRRESKLHLPEFYQRIFKLPGRSYIGFTGHFSDWNLLKREVIHDFIQDMRALGKEPDPEAVARIVCNRICFKLLHGVLHPASLPRSHDDEEDAQPKVPIGHRLVRPLAVTSIIPNAAKSASDQFFWEINAAGIARKVRTAVSGGAGALAAVRFIDQSDQEHFSSARGVTDDLLDKIEDILESFAEEDIFEIALLSSTGDKRSHILPTTKTRLLDEITKTLVDLL